MPEFDHAVNVPLLTKVLDHVTAHPEEHDQSTWATRTRCGTAMCVAGWATHMSGHTLCYIGSFSEDFAVVTTEGELISMVARRELGLTETQAADLFAAHNTVADLWEMAAEYTRGEIQPPPGMGQ